jgi:hypothetical protein
MRYAQRTTPQMNFEAITKAISCKTFQASKPIREIEPIDLKRNIEVVGSRKYNGNFASAIVQNGDISFYTASNLPLATLSGKHWQIDANWRGALRSIPERSILLGEVHIPNTKIEDLGGFQVWYTYHMNQLEGTGAPLPCPASFRVFDVLCWDGAFVGHQPYRERFEQIPAAIRVEKAPYLRLQEAQEAVEMAKTRGIEGFVFWDANARTFCKLSGKNKARAGAWKVKPRYKEVFEVKGVVNADPAALVLLLANGAIEFNCGSGLVPAQRQELIAAKQAGKRVEITVAHYGIDETGRPEIPTMQGLTVS